MLTTSVTDTLPSCMPSPGKLSKRNENSPPASPLPEGITGRAVEPLAVERLVHVGILDRVGQYGPDLIGPSPPLPTLSPQVAVVVAVSGDAGEISVLVIGFTLTRFSETSSILTTGSLNVIEIESMPVQGSGLSWSAPVGIR